MHETTMVLPAAALLVAVSCALGGQQVDAGPGDIDITYHFSGGVDPTAAATAFVPELFEAGGQDVQASCSSPIIVPGNTVTTVKISCDSGLTGGSFVIGGSNLGSHQVTGGTCTKGPSTEKFSDAFATFSVGSQEAATCNVTLVAPPALYLDKAIIKDAGPLTAADFTLGIYQNGSLIASVVDPSPAFCGLPSAADPSVCAAIALPPGNYTIGEQPEYGYAAVGINCVQDIAPPNEPFPGTLGDFVHGAGNQPTACVVTNQYETVPVKADIVVVNDDGGTAVGADFTIEVFDSNGVVVASGIDPEPGTANMSVEFVLPIGAHTFGVSGPAGYTASAAITFTKSPEIIADPSAAFLVTSSERAHGVITVNDPPAPPPPTTPPTTLPPTTPAAASTTIPLVLPETGTGDASPFVALIASMVLLLGGAATAIARRPNS